MEPIRKITNEQKDKALGHLFPSLLPFQNFDFVSPLHQFFSVFQLLSVFDNFSSHLYIFYFTFYILTCWDISNSTFKQQSTINLIWFWTQFWVNSINPFFSCLGQRWPWPQYVFLPFFIFSWFHSHLIFAWFLLAVLQYSETTMIDETQHMATVIPTINLFAVYQ